jgi:hypothetical protein
VQYYTAHLHTVLKRVFVDISCMYLGGSKQKLVFLGRLNVGPFNGGLNVAKKAEIAMFALKLDAYFDQSDDHLKTSLQFDQMPYQKSPSFENVSEAMVDARLLSFQEEVAASSANFFTCSSC